MKFPQLPIGSHFAFNGEKFVKTGPLTASRQADGQSRMIPRSAAIVAADSVDGDSPGTAEGNPSSAHLREAIETYHRHCLAACTAPSVKARTAEIEQAYRELLRALELR